MDGGGIERTCMVVIDTTMITTMLYGFDEILSGLLACIELDSSR